MKISGFQDAGQDLHIEWQGGKSSTFSYFWLRDNARDCESFNTISHQREVFTAGIAADICPEKIEITANGESVEIKWPDRNEMTEYKSEFLSKYIENTVSQNLPEPKIWEANNFPKKITQFDFNKVTKNSIFASLLESISFYGFALIKNCPCEPNSVAKIAQKIGYIRETIFGGLWEFEANESMADSAYTPKELRPHTDSTYSSDAPGLQLLLCTAYNATGGESIIVDGFAVAKQLQTDDKELYDALSQINVVGVYRGDGVILEASRPILRHDDRGRLIQVTFNNYDRATMRLSEPNMTQLYAGIRYIDKLFNSSVYQWRYQLDPGDMLIFDNWRVLHGRAAFSGKRKMAGAYINREDFISALKMHSLISSQS